MPRSTAAKRRRTVSPASSTTSSSSENSSARPRAPHFHMSLRRASELPTCKNVRLQDLSETDSDDEDFQIVQDDASSSERGTAVTDGPEDKDADENEEDEDE